MDGRQNCIDSSPLLDNCSEDDENFSVSRTSKTSYDVIIASSETASSEECDVAEEILAFEDACYHLHEEPIELPIIPKYKQFFSTCFPCFSELCRRHGGSCVDWVLLISHLITLALTTIGVFSFFKDRQDSHGQCLIGAEFLPSGVMLYTPNNYWCETSFYGSLIAGSSLFGIISINWLTPLHSTIQWMHAQVALTVFGLLTTTTGAVLMTVGFVFWCEHLDMSSNCTDSGMACKDQHSSPLSFSHCHEVAVHYDEKYYKFDSMALVYKSTVFQMLIGAVLCVMWIILLSFVLWKRHVTILRFCFS